MVNFRAYIPSSPHGCPSGRGQFWPFLPNPQMRNIWTIYRQVQETSNVAKNIHIMSLAHKIIFISARPSDNSKDFKLHLNLSSSWSISVTIVVPLSCTAGQQPFRLYLMNQRNLNVTIEIWNYSFLSRKITTEMEVEPYSRINCLYTVYNVNTVYTIQPAEE